MKTSSSPNQESVRIDKVSFGWDALMLKFFVELYTILALLTSIMDIGAGAQASPGQRTMWALKSPCPFGCMGCLALGELLISFYI